LATPDAVAREISDSMVGLVESAPEAMVVVDEQGTIVMVNARTERLFDYDRGELEGCQLELLVPGTRHRSKDDRRAQYSVDQHARQPGARHELHGLRKDGSEFLVEISLSPVATATGVLVANAIRDVSDHRELWNVAARLAAVVEASADAIYSTALDGTLLSWNRAAERLYGYTEAEAMGKSYRLIVPVDLNDEIDAFVQRIEAGESVDQLETVRRCQDGSLVHVSLTISPIYDAAGRLIGSSRIARDITEDKRAERELASARVAIDQFFGVSPDVMAIIDAAGNFTRVNPALERTLGLGADQIVGHSFAEFMHADDRQASIDRYAARVSGAAVPSGFENRFRSADGSYRWLRWSSARPVGGLVYTTARDITEDRRAERELQRLADAADYGTNAIVSVDFDGHVGHWNRGAELLYGFSAEEAIGRDIDELNPSGDEPGEAGAQAAVLAGETVFHVEVKQRRKDGAVLDVLKTFTPWHQDGQIVGTTAVAIDVTERKRAERVLKRAFEDLDDAQRTARIGSFSWDMSADEAVWSPQMYRLFGRDRTEGAATGEQFMAYVELEDRKRVAAGYAQTFGGEESFELDYQIMAGDGTRRTLHSLGRRDDANPALYIGTVQDVTELRQAEREVRRERDYAAAITSSMREGLLLTRDGAILDVNQALCEMTGFPKEQLIGARVPYPFWGPDSAEQIQRHRKAVRTGDSDQVEVRYMRADGTGFEVSINTVVAHPAGGELLGYVSTIRDITDEKRHRTELERLGTHDSLTGLLNHRVFHVHLGVEIARAERHKRPLSVAVLDLDHFKDINDRYGHPTGDKVLREAGRRLRTVIRDGEQLARVGGEEFAWILPDATTAGAYAAAERARRVITASPFPDVGAVTLSAGVCQLGDALDAEQLYDLADQALYSAKQRGRNQTCAHDPVSSRRAGRPPSVRTS
jgi:diguanylate cyclase (GGDEF)-like protein/PAS domain S-box-containing protein